MSTMDPLADGCRLCLDPFAEQFTTIENPELKQQMEKVFCFAVESKQGHHSGVCQSCSHAISEFYQYSEKVRQNQELLNENSVKIEIVEIELLGNSEPSEMIDETSEEIMIPEEQVADHRLTDDDDESSDQSLPEKPQSSRKRRPRKPKSDGFESEAKEPTRREKDEQLFSKHFSMVCDLCGVQTASFKLLRKHFWQEHNLRDGYVVCCNKKLSRWYAIREHIHFHANPDIFRCKVCGKTYKNKDTLITHQAVHKGNDFVKICDVCGREFKSRYGFQLHMGQKHSVIKVERSQCNVCLRWFNSRKNLQKHMYIHGEQVDCDICMQTYASKAALRRHKKQTHIEPEHECEFCGKRFKRALGLKEHRTTHTGEVLYSCEHCGMKSNSKAYMYKHIKHKHPVEWEKKQSD